MSGLVLFLSGVLAMGYAVAALFFLRFWRQTHDRLFALFAAAFALLAVHRSLLAIGTADAFYLLRLAAYALIIIAIVDKNRDAR